MGGPGGKIAWSPVSETPEAGPFCNSPRHRGMQIPSAYVMAIVYDDEGLEPTVQEMCTECMNRISMDVMGVSAEKGCVHLSGGAS